jgi:transposase
MAVGSKNRGFHYELYSQFKEKDNTVLRDIRSEFIEEWLREHDADLLHRLYVERKQVYIPLHSLSLYTPLHSLSLSLLTCSVTHKLM